MGNCRCSNPKTGLRVRRSFGEWQRMTAIRLLSVLLFLFSSTRNCVLGAEQPDTNSVWLAEIVRYRKREILERLQHSFGKDLVAKISFRVG